MVNLSNYFYKLIFLSDIFVISTISLWTIIPISFYLFDNNKTLTLEGFILVSSVISFAVGYLLVILITKKKLFTPKSFIEIPNQQIKFIKYLNLFLLAILIGSFRVFFDFGMVENALNHLFSGFFIAFASQFLILNNSKLKTFILLLCLSCAFYGLTVRLVWPLLFMIVFLLFIKQKNGFISDLFLFLMICMLGAFFSIYFKSNFETRISYETSKILIVILKDLSNIESFENAKLFYEQHGSLYGAGLIALLIFPWMLFPETYSGSGKLMLLSNPDSFLNNINRSTSVPLPFELVINLGVLGVLFSFILGFFVRYTINLYIYSNLSIQKIIFLHVFFLSLLAYCMRGDLIFGLIPSILFFVGGFLFFILKKFSFRIN